ncbi:M14 family metallopeptidase [Marinobacterium jannaschii]|uniref:M14 family metallopeptidase n=1 Tax=Marinobacterium jannaschii TaxID=64970 RepID=UPI000482551A|nr:M14-type cytosolic carboxypeptidase [Marinobacterium jannaschii]
MLKISSGFDAGNIEVLDAGRSDDIQLAIRKDNNSDFFQWFHYRVQGAMDQALKMRLCNASEAAYVDGWDDYQAVASYDRKYWFRVPTRYDNGELVIEHEPEQNSIYYAYFAPYSYERHLDLIGWAQQSPLVAVEDLGTTLDGRDMNLLRIGEPSPEKKVIWLTARQHPGETMAEWCMEGFLDSLLDSTNAQARRLLQRAVVYAVPNMNPDGAARGHLRTNAVGANLNREWQTPTPERSPEVLVVREAMERSGVDLFLDLHGDEALPVNFIAGQLGVPTASEAVLQQEHQFELDLMAASADFQMERGYEPGKFGEETMTIAANWVGHRFDCPAMTLEMPFKDHDLMPDPEQGWSAERSMRLGEALLFPLTRWLEPQ